MSRLISAFPHEIIENILSCLQGEDLINASEVCWQWNCVAYRLMQKVIHSVFSPELLEDISLDVQEKLGDPLLDVYREAIEELHLESEIDAIELSNSISALEADGDRLYVRDITGSLVVYELMIAPNHAPYFSPEPSLVVPLPEGPIMHLGLMKCKELLVVASPSKLHFFSTANVCKFGLKSLIPNWDFQKKNMAFSIDKDLLGVSETSSNVKIFRVEQITSEKLVMKMEASFDTLCAMYCWKIWNNQVLCVLKNGGFAVWDLAQDNFSYISQPYHELRYQNPCWMFQRYILCSSELSRNLLCRYIYMMPTCPAAYWHISCGPSYWLFGRVDGRQSPEPEKYRGVLSPDVTTMCLRRRLVVCARKSPDQILVYQMPRNLPHDKETLTCALQCPILILPTSEPTVMLDVTFQGPRVLIFATGPSSSLRCYVLTRNGHGTTPSPTPSPEPSQEELDMLNLPNIDHNLAYPVAND